MSKSKILLFILLAFIGGVFARSFFEISQNCLLTLLVFSIVLLTIFYKNRYAALVAFILLFFAIGIWRMENSLERIEHADKAGKIFNENALVLKSSESSFGQNVIMKLEQEKIVMLLQVPTYPAFHYGDLLEVLCRAKRIENKEDSDFDYMMYMAKEGVLYSCEDKNFRKIGEHGGNIFLTYILGLKNLLEKNINDVIPSPESVLAGGILLGGSRGFSKEIQNDFSRTGMTHIVAVSGYNVTIIAEYFILFGIALGLWRKQAIWFAIIGIALFVIMIGLPASAVRAGVMSGILLWAMKHGRLASSENAIIFAGAIMLFLNPLLLRYDIGFQLSFLATLGIVQTSPFWEKSFIKKHKAFGISEIIALSLSAQIFVLPIITYNFHTASLVSLLANVLILPIVPLSMFLAFLTALAEFIFSPLSLILAWLTYLPLHYEILLIHVLSQFSWASVEIEKVSVLFVVVYYIILTLSIYLLDKYLNRRDDK